MQCLHDFDIPLYLSHTITRITGSPRVESVTISKVDEKRNPIPGTEITFDCDTVLLSVGLIPENEVAKSAGIALDPRTKGPIVYENMETSIEGIFASGNTVHVHDLVDYVTAESQRAGRCAAEYVKVARVTNINDAIDELKENNVWVYAADMSGKSVYETDVKGAVAFVVGGEGQGVKRLTLSKCDGVVSIPMRGKVNSLNASVAAGVVVFEKLRQDYS